MREELLEPQPADDGERAEEAGLRPKRLNEFVGQRELKEHLEIVLEAARRRAQAADHLAATEDQSRRVSARAVSDPHRRRRPERQSVDRARVNPYLRLRQRRRQAPDHPVPRRRHHDAERSVLYENRPPDRRSRLLYVFGKLIVLVPRSLA